MALDYRQSVTRMTGGVSSYPEIKVEQTGNEMYVDCLLKRSSLVLAVLFPLFSLWKLCTSKLLQSVSRKAILCKM